MCNPVPGCAPRGWGAQGDIPGVPGREESKSPQCELGLLCLPQTSSIHILLHVMCLQFCGREGSGANPLLTVYLMNLAQNHPYFHKLWGRCVWGWGVPCVPALSLSSGCSFQPRLCVYFQSLWGCRGWMGLLCTGTPPLTFISTAAATGLCSVPSSHSSSSPSHQSLSFQPNFSSNWKSSSSKMPKVNGFC